MYWVVALGLLLLNTAVFAQSDSFWMTETELNAAFAGQSIEGHYDDGRTFSEVYNLDHSLEYIEGERKKSGKWSIVDGTFCTIYNKSLAGGCFRVLRSGTNCYEFYFLARTEETVRDMKRKGKISWTARAWHKDVVSTCQERPVV